jgi:hypothetical protein
MFPDPRSGTGAMTRNLSHRLGRLETRFAPIHTFHARVCLVHPEKGVTGVLVIDGDKPALHVPPTPEEVEKVRADLERRRVARLSWNGGTN